MKLSKDEIQFIESVARTAALFNIDTIIIEPDLVRAIDEERTVYLRQTDNIPTLSFKSICITRVGLFLSRLDIAKGQENFTVEAVMHKSGDFVQSLIFRGKGTKIEYLGSNPLKTKVHRDLNDVRACQVKLNGNVVFLMQKGQVAMGAELVNIISNDEVTFEFMDVNKDVFSYTFPEAAEALTDDNVTKFAHKYIIKHILTLFKQNPDGYFSIGGRIGTLTVEINGITVYIIPQN